MKRTDDFTERRRPIAELSDAELKERFWELAEKIVDPMIDMARTYTSPSIERSVLLRMGFSSLEAKAIVEQTIDRGLMGKGAGHAVFALSRLEGCPVREAGLRLMDGKDWDKVKEAFGKGAVKHGQAQA